MLENLKLDSFRCSSIVLNELGKITKDFEKKQLSNFVISHTVIPLHFELHKIFFKLRIYRFVEMWIFVGFECCSILFTEFVQIREYSQFRRNEQFFW